MQLLYITMLYIILCIIMQTLEHKHYHAMIVRGDIHGGYMAAVYSSYNCHIVYINAYMMYISDTVL